jgi:KaiC/GvpD/RAD55 family RecA-like ATPase
MGKSKSREDALRLKDAELERSAIDPGTPQGQPEDDLPAAEVSSNPIEDIDKEIDKAARSPKHVGLFNVKKANDWIEDAMSRPDPRMFFHDLIVQYENTVLFAQTNVGKSILAVQMAEDIARTDKVLYIDLELADKQFQMRYTDPDTGEVHIFPENFNRAEIDPELIVGADLEEEILFSIEEAAKQGTKFVILDNLTFACNDSEKGANASSFMMKVIRLKKQYFLTTIVVAHTPKIRGYQPITHYDLAGSARLISFFDAGIAVARSAKDNNLRYIKQVKVRTGAYKYDAENVIICDVQKVNGCLRFEIQDYGQEADHLKEGSGTEELEEIYAILRLQADGKSVRDIARTLDMSKSTVDRRLQKAKEQGITLPKDETDDVPDVPTVPHAGQPGRSGQPKQQRLPYKDEE